MKYKVLFAKTGIAKFMALLVTLLAMFASCNFLGGEEARAVVGGTNAPDKYTKPEAPGEALPPFKSLSAATIQPWSRNWEGGDNSPLFAPTYGTGEFILQPTNDYSGAGGGGYFGGAFGAFDNGVPTGAKFDVSKVAYATYEVKASEPVAGFMITLSDKNPSNTAEEEAKIDLTTQWQTKKISCDYRSNGVDIVARLYCGGSDEPKATTDTKIYLRNFIFYDKDDNEVVPQYYADGNVPELPSDGSTTVTLDGVEYSYDVWFAVWGWNPVENQPTVEQSNDGIKLTVNDGNIADDWHGQFKLFGDGVNVVKDTNYDINVVVRTTKDTQGVTLKPTVKDKEDAGAFAQDKKDFKENEDVKFEFNKVPAKESGTLAVVFNFHGCETGTEILIKELTFKKSDD